MRFANGSLVASALLMAARAQEDVLYSKRGLAKRRVNEEGDYNIAFYHINDVHAHLDEFRPSGTNCSDPDLGCYGGYARVKTVLDQSRPEHPNSLFLSVGDEFQGTFFYTYYGGKKIAETLNQLGLDGMTLGNHEFDGGPDKLGEFISSLNFPVISANVKSTHPVLSQVIKPFHIYPAQQLAVIGVTTPTTSDTSSPGPDTTFTDVTEAVQRTIDFIKATTSITRIAAITHIGYENDKKLAAATTGLHLIMGGHSHTPLGNLPGAVGDYPTIATNKDGDEVFIVTAYRWGEYLGYIDVTYDDAGKILAYHGAPFHLTNATDQDPQLQKQILAWRKPFDEFAGQVVGTSRVTLGHSTCRVRECLLGQVMADALLHYNREHGGTAALGVMNGGGVRATIDVGPITRGQALTTFPLGNSLVEIALAGHELWNTFEGVLSGVNQYTQRGVEGFIHLSAGVEIEYDAAAPRGSKLVSVKIDGVDLNMDKTYNVATLDFLADGGDNIFLLHAYSSKTAFTDDVFVSYVERNSPLDAELVHRIVDTNGAPAPAPATER